VSLRSWRIAKRKHAGETSTGEGARAYGGRWNSPGVTMVYTAEHASLAILEVLVHLGGAQLLPDYVLFGVEFDEALAEAVDEAALPEGWRAFPAPVSLRPIGDQWVGEGRSAVLSVPSAVLPLERLFLLNPQHPDFPSIRIGDAQAFPLDARLQR